MRQLCHLYLRYSMSTMCSAHDSRPSSAYAQCDQSDNATPWAHAVKEVVIYGQVVDLQSKYGHVEEPSVDFIPSPPTCTCSLSSAAVCLQPKRTAAAPTPTACCGALTRRGRPVRGRSSPLHRCSAAGGCFWHGWGALAGQGAPQDRVSTLRLANKT